MGNILNSPQHQKGKKGNDCDFKQLLYWNYFNTSKFELACYMALIMFLTSL